MILVTGASGYIGSRVARLLAPHGGAAMVRDFTKAPGGVPVKIADYENKDSLIKALGRVQTLVFVPSDGFAEDVSRHCRNVFEAAQFAGVGRVVFLSIVDTAEDSPFYYASVYREAEEYLWSTKVPSVIVRSGLYSDFVDSAFIEPARQSGVLELPAEDAKVRLISRDDVAARLADIALGESLEAVNLIEGVSPTSFDEIARSNDLAYKNIDPAVYYDRVNGQMEAPWPEAFSSLFASIRQGRFT